MNDQLSFYVQKYFLSYLINQRNYGANTVSSYRDTFRLLLSYMESSGWDIAKLKVTDVDSERVTAFLKWLEDERENSVSTRNVRLAHLKSFARYLMLNAPEYSDHCSKILGIPFARTEKHPPECLTTDAVKQLLSAVDASTKEGLRHLAILSLLYDSGCRVQELIELNTKDFQSGHCSRIYVHGKGNKYRTIPLLHETEKVVSLYIKRYQLSGDQPLFMNSKGDRLTRQGVRYIIKKYADIANKESPGSISTNVYPHLLRHSKATHLVEKGVNIYNVKDFLGHESVVTTQVYLTSNPEVTRKAIETAASETAPNSTSYYTENQKASLLEFLESLK